MKKEKHEKEWQDYNQQRAQSKSITMNSKGSKPLQNGPPRKCQKSSIDDTIQQNEVEEEEEEEEEETEDEEDLDAADVAFIQGTHLMNTFEDIKFSESTLYRVQHKIPIDHTSSCFHPFFKCETTGPLVIYFRKPLTLTFSRNNEQRLLTVELLMAPASSKELEQLESCPVINHEYSPKLKEYLQASPEDPVRVEIRTRVPLPYQIPFAAKFETQDFIGVVVPRVENEAVL